VPSLFNFFVTPNSASLVVITEGTSTSGACLLPQEALDDISAIVATDAVNNPSVRALQTHIADLEQEVRDADFRLYFLYRQRLAHLEMLSTAKSRVEPLKA